MHPQDFEPLSWINIELSCLLIEVEGKRDWLDSLLRRTRLSGAAPYGTERIL